MENTNNAIHSTASSALNRTEINYEQYYFSVGLSII